MIVELRKLSGAGEEEFLVGVRFEYPIERFVPTCDCCGAELKCKRCGGSGFKHGHPAFVCPDCNGKGKEKVERRMARCVLEELSRGENGRLRVVNKLLCAEAVTHPKDVYVKPVGRLLSFKRAIDLYIDTQDMRIKGGARRVRRAFWDAWRKTGVRMPKARYWLLTKACVK